MTKPIRSMKSFESRYYPEDPEKQEQERIDKMSPQELGEHWAKLTIVQIRVALAPRNGRKPASGASDDSS